MATKLKKDIAYTPLRVEKMRIKDVRKAYSELRGIASRRMKQLEKKGFTSYEVYKNAKKDLQGLPSAKTLSTQEVKDLLVETATFLRKPFSLASTINRFENDQVKHFNRMGFKFINKKNIRRFHKYMNSLSEKYGAKAIQSFKAVRLFNEAERLGVSTKDIEDNFYSWSSKIDLIEKEAKDNLKAYKGKGARSSYLKKKLKIV